VVGFVGELTSSNDSGNTSCEVRLNHSRAAFSPWLEASKLTLLGCRFRRGRSGFKVPATGCRVHGSSSRSHISENGVKHIGCRRKGYRVQDAGFKVQQKRMKTSAWKVDIGRGDWGRVGRGDWGRDVQDFCVCVCVCVFERERESESETEGGWGRDVKDFLSSPSKEFCVEGAIDRWSYLALKPRAFRGD